MATGENGLAQRQQACGIPAPRARSHADPGFYEIRSKWRSNGVWISPTPTTRAFAASHSTRTGSGRESGGAGMTRPSRHRWGSSRDEGASAAEARNGRSAPSLLDPGVDGVRGTPHTSPVTGKRLRVLSALAVLLIACLCATGAGASSRLFPPPGRIVFSSYGGNNSLLHCCDRWDGRSADHKQRVGCRLGTALVA